MKVYVTDHAIVRYQERVKPQLPRLDAKAELERLVEMAGSPEHDQLELAPGIFMPVERERGKLLGVTVKTRSGFSEEVRERRNRKASYRRARRRTRNRGNGNRNFRRGRRPDPEDSWD